MALKRTSIPAHPTNYHVGRQGKHVQFIVIHDGETNEGPTAAEGMASWFASDHGAGRRSSAHESADTDSVCRSVADKNTAFGAPGVNNTGWHLEHAGRAGQSASQWDDAASRLILANGAQAAAEASVRLASLTADRKPIPAVWLTDAQLRAAQTNPLIKGFITHRQVSRVLGGTHTDPGANFPSDRYMALVRSHLGPPPQEDDDMAYTPEELEGFAGKGVHSQRIGRTDVTMAQGIQRAYVGVAALQAQVAALTNAVEQLAANGGGSVDIPAVEAAAERAVRTVLGSLDQDS